MNKEYTISTITNNAVYTNICSFFSACNHIPIYTSNNIKERLSDRNFMTALREMGFESEKNKSFDQRTINEFASSLDTIINKYKKEFC